MNNDDITREEIEGIAQGLREVAEGKITPFSDIEKELEANSLSQQKRIHIQRTGTLKDFKANS